MQRGRLRLRVVLSLVFVRQDVHVRSRRRTRAWRSCCALMTGEHTRDDPAVVPERGGVGAVDRYPDRACVSGTNRHVARRMDLLALSGLEQARSGDLAIDRGP